VTPTRLGLLDRVPRIVRHLLIQLAAVLLAWGASDLVPWLGQHGGVAAIAGALLGQLLLIVTPLVRTYGVGQPAAGPRPDGGYARAVWRPALVLTFALIGFAVLTSSAAFAHPPRRPAAAPVLHLGIGGAGDCSGTIVVAYGTETLDGTAWSARPDDGRVGLQVHYVGDGSGAGAWTTVPAVSGGEGRLRLAAGGPTFDLVRVIRTDTGVTSTPRPIGLCPA
jgi:hypothetical protein